MTTRQRYRWLIFLLLLLPVWWYFPWIRVDTWKKGPPPTWAFLEDHMQDLSKTGDHTRPSRMLYQYVPLEAISLELQTAILVGEDIEFLNHGPIDWDATQLALQEWQRGKKLRGASTISQQLAKNLFLSSRRSFFRKLNEWRLAAWLERNLGKRRIWELYLNIIELGEGIYGVEAASKYYFGTSAASVGASQAASIAASIPWPKSHNPKKVSLAWQRKRNTIAARSAEAMYVRSQLKTLRKNGEERN